jgi:hypothetical protein
MSENYLIIKRTDGREDTRLEIIVVAPTSLAAKLERQILFETSKENIPYVNQAPEKG